MAQALYRKWRPQSFDDVVGQEHITTTLKNQIATNRVGHAYLFVGSRGCGKTSTARILAKEINVAGFQPGDPHTRQLIEAITEGRAMDVIEIDAASHTKVEEIREVLERVAFQPTEVRFKVYIIDEVHMLSLSSFNALLKTLEEPPPHVIFILATTDPQKIPATVLSRCQRFNFKRVPVRLIVGRLRQICESEGIEADDHALTLIARQATGALRDAISLLDQLASSSSMRITADDVREALGATDAATVRGLMSGLAERDAATGLDAIQSAIDQGADARQIARQMIDYQRAALQLRIGRKDAQNVPAELSEAERLELTGFADRMSAASLLRGIRAFSFAINDMRGNTDAQLPLEMAFLDCVTADDGGQPAQESSQARQAEEPRPDPSSVSSPAGGRAVEAQPPAETVAPIARREPAAVQTKPAASDAAKPTAASDSTAVFEPAGDVTVEQLRSLWKQLIQDVNATNKAAAALLRSCHPQAVVGDVIRLQADHDLIRQRLDDPKNKGSVATALARLLNGKYTIQVSTAQQQEPDPADDPLLKAAHRLGGKLRE